MSLKTQLIIAGVLVAATAALTRYYFPRIETQTVDVVKEVVKTDIRTITKIVEHPDGTKETVIDHTDKSVENKDQKHSETVMSKSQWLVTGTVQQDLNNGLNLQPIYGVHVQRRILGPFYLGAMGSTDKRAGVSLGMEF